MTGHDEPELTGCRAHIEVAQKYSVPLFVGVALAMTVANVAEDFYNDLFFTSWGFDIGGHDVTFAFLINDILMAIHFGLALQEIAVACLPGGAMSPISKAANPIIATLGGLFGPIGVFFLLSSVLHSADSFGSMPPEHRPVNGGTCGAAPMAAVDGHRRLGSSAPDAVINITDPNPEKYSYEIIAKGWGIVTATDIPLAWVGAEIIFGAGHPAITYLLLLAVADDFCGVIIIAIFYPDPNHPFAAGWLMLVASSMLTAYVFRVKEVGQWWIYAIVCGAQCWCGLLFTGVHPALALVPWIPFLPAVPPSKDRKLKTDAAAAEVEGLTGDEPMTPPMTPTKSVAQVQDEHDLAVKIIYEHAKITLGPRYTGPGAELPADCRDELEQALATFGVEGSASRMDDMLKGKLFSLQNAAEAFLTVQIDVIQQALHSKTLFAQMDSEHIRQLATGIASKELKKYEKGHKVITQNESGDHMYLIAQGTVEIDVNGAVVSTRKAGDKATTAADLIFGDTSLIQAAPRSATVTCTDTVKCWDVSFEDLLSFPHVHDELERMRIAFNDAMAAEDSFEDDFHASAMHGFEHGLKKFMVFVVLFLFACANAGVTIKTSPGPLALTISASLLVGKFFGIVCMAMMADRFIAPCPDMVGFKEILVIGLIAAIGMTIALFISVEAFNTCPELEADAKLGSLFSVAFFPLAMLAGYLLDVKIEGGESHSNVSDAIEDALYVNTHHESATERALEAAANAAHEAEIEEITKNLKSLTKKAEEMRQFIAKMAAEKNFDMPAEFAKPIVETHELEDAEEGVPAKTTTAPAEAAPTEAPTEAPPV